MWGLVKKIWGGASVDYAQLMAEGAQIIDVRTPAEFKGGHIKGAKNIPLQSLGNQLHQLDTHQTYLLVCASGMRSGSAKGVLKRHGFTHVYNAGSWSRLQDKL